ncbi:hypothetical protein B0H11DRAFT_2268921 [Mycena galericulata]|nr:hypothetical protein B0H11DRAFT_2283083 [Mycena galericulata]KAJ7512014.1 hypothetical protein B0H11DRAFT_2268921 [Mycena galericulata]
MFISAPLRFNITTDSAYIVRSTTLHPFHAFTNLTDVEVLVPYGSTLDDAFVRAMAISWPKNRGDFPSLAESQSVLGGQTDRSQVTIQEFLSSAQHCPALRELKLVLTNTLSRLDGLDSPTHSSFQIASFLSTVYPRFRRMDYMDDGYVVERKWTEVKGLVPHFVKLRAQEESHWRQ